MKARTLGLALVVAGYSFPALAGDNSQLEIGMQQLGAEAVASIKADIAVKPAPDFEQVYADLRSYPRRNLMLADGAVSKGSEHGAASSDTDSVAIGSAAAETMSRAASQEAASTAKTLRRTFGFGLFGVFGHR